MQFHNDSSLQQQQNKDLSEAEWDTPIVITEYYRRIIYHIQIYQL